MCNWSVASRCSGTISPEVDFFGQFLKNQVLVDFQKIGRRTFKRRRRELQSVRKYRRLRTVNLKEVSQSYTWSWPVSLCHRNAKCECLLVWKERNTFPFPRSSFQWHKSSWHYTAASRFCSNRTSISRGFLEQRRNPCSARDRRWFGTFEIAQSYAWIYMCT